MNNYDEAHITATAFFNALLSGRLSSDTRADNYVGDYMYMFEEDGKDFFKHIDTRKYLKSDTIEQDDEVKTYLPTIWRHNGW